ncbi:ZrgA family zinc uptake protein [Endozoicomonas lisbonensis]|uniref:Zinc-binding protein n=1 Tax=Endozoicomonas lisbonensis TaxID=3120522 RepID=A0ABV2SJW2_9GAMM
MRTSIRMAAAAACTLAVSGAAMAHSHHHNDEVRHAGAHVHGEGELNFATEGSELHLELMMPAHDILGFESINTHAQKKQLNEALEKLESDTIWSLSVAAGCQLNHAHASPTKEIHVKDGHGHGHDKHDHDHGHSHDKHDHDHGHSHDKHDHDHEHHHDHDHDGHMDIAASYVYECKAVNQLNQLSTALFEAFPRSERIRVQGFTQSGQLSETMTPNQPQVRF